MAKILGEAGFEVPDSVEGNLPALTMRAVGGVAAEVAGALAAAAGNSLAAAGNRACLDTASIFHRDTGTAIGSEVRSSLCTVGVVSKTWLMHHSLGAEDGFGRLPAMTAWKCRQQWLGRKP